MLVYSTDFRCFLSVSFLEDFDLKRRLKQLRQVGRVFVATSCRLREAMCLFVQYGGVWRIMVALRGDKTPPHLFIFCYASPFCDNVASTFDVATSCGQRETMRLLFQFGCVWRIMVAVRGEKRPPHLSIFCYASPFCDIVASTLDATTSVMLVNSSMEFLLV